MPALISGYEYDVFISYRHNDNLDGWVTDFVQRLEKELRGTIKETLTLYFDKNLQDGLLETHHVDKSLAGKLKSLILIPIISQTYCDTKSFAWQQEFCAFNKLASSDTFGRDVLLASGNVASRILPIRIHDLDDADQRMLDGELDGALRAVEFIYKSAGVNRPMTPADDRQDNVNKTVYRDQINKVANAIKEIVLGMLNPVSGVRQPVLTPSKTLTMHKSIVVLPFVNMSNDPEQEYFSDGISEEIINTLVQIPTLKVAGRTSAFSFKNKNEDLRTIGEKLNVNTILEGSVRKSGNRIRITAQLIETATGFHLWSQKFDRELNDVFVIQDEIAKAIVDELQITWAGKPVQPKERIQTQNVEAYQLYLKGMALFYKRGLDMFEGLNCFEDALKLDNEYALALVGVADSHTMLCLHSYLSPEQAWPRAAEAANRALELSPELAEAHNSVATIALLCERNWSKAEAGYKKALALNPNYVQARCWFALFYLQSVWADNEEAERQVRLAIECDPLNAYAHTVLGSVSSIALNYDAGINSNLKAVEFDSNSFAPWYWLGFSYQCSGNLTLAIKNLIKALEVSGRHTWALSSLLVTYVDNNQLAEANIIYVELKAKAKQGYVAPSVLAITSAALGKNVEAIQYAMDACNRRDPFQTVSIRWPDSRRLRAIPECAAIWQILNYPQTPSLD